MPLTERGFERPSYEELLQTQITRAKTLFGETIDTSELTALGKYLRINVADLDMLYQILEGVYYARFPNTATGTSLDRLCPYAGITRKPATYATHRVQIVGTAGTVINTNFEVANENQSVVFHITDVCTIGTNGTVLAIVECNEAGEVGNIPSAAINTIINPLLNVERVQGVEIVGAGEDRESDEQLRDRFKLNILGSSNGTEAAIQSAVMSVPGVELCKIFTTTTHNQGFSCHIKSNETPETDRLIAEAIFSKKPIGVRTFGSVSVDLDDASGNEHTINFNRVSEKSIYVKMTIRVSSEFPENGTSTIKENIINYLRTLSIGEYVYLTSLFPQIYIQGVKNVPYLYISENGIDYIYNNIAVSDTAVARTTADKISIEVTS